MLIRSLKLAYFSPTGTTASIVQAMARGLQQDTTEHFDITMEAARRQPLRATADDLLVVAVPVYGGRIPALLGEWLNGLQLDKTPVVCVAVYGNRDYEDALLELTDIVKERGGVPVACATFIGEHSFSNPAVPIAVSRPDAEDLRLAEEFGRKVREAVKNLTSVEAAHDIAIPGNRPYKERKERVSFEFIAVGDNCIQCGVCAEHCPVGAITIGDQTETDNEKCIRCCACIKYCPEQARTMMADSPIMDIAKWLGANCQERKEPESFF